MTSSVTLFDTRRIYDLSYAGEKKANIKHALLWSFFEYSQESQTQTLSGPAGPQNQIPEELVSRLLRNLRYI